MTTENENTATDPALTAAAGSIFEAVTELETGYNEMKVLAQRVISTIATNFHHGTLKTGSEEGNANLKEMIVGWENCYNRAELKRSKPLQSNSKMMDDA